MSILIRGMEMPAKGWHKVIRIFGDGTVVNCYDCFELGKAVPVPPHGDLIDRDALMRHKGDCYDADGHLLYAVGTGNILCAPTIIPASEDAKTEEESEPWLCLSCRHYPPSSTDSKPCSQCNPSEVWHSCYDPAEEGE